MTVGYVVQEKCCQFRGVLPMRKTAMITTNWILAHNCILQMAKLVVQKLKAVSSIIINVNKYRYNNTPKAYEYIYFRNDLFAMLE